MISLAWPCDWLHAPHLNGILPSDLVDIRLTFLAFNTINIIGVRHLAFCNQHWLKKLCLYQINVNDEHSGVGLEICNLFSCFQWGNVDRFISKRNIMKPCLMGEN